MRIKSLLLAGIFSLFCSTAYCADNGNGVNVTTKDFSDLFTMHAEWFTGYDPENSSTYVYNESAGTSTSSGELDTSLIKDGGVISVGLPTFGVGTVTVRLEGKTKGAAFWTEITNQAYTGATGIAQKFSISDYWDAIRVGALVTGSAVDSLNVEGDFISKKRK